MKNHDQILLKLTFALSFFCFSGGALAKGSAVRIGVLDMQKIILSVDEGKNARDELAKEIKAKESEFKKQKKELDALNRSWKKEAAMLSEQARLRKQQEFQQKFMALRSAEMEFQGNIKKKEAQVTQKIAFKVAKIVDTMAKEQNIDTVFERNSSGLMYVKGPIDLTDKVIAKYGKANSSKKVGKNLTEKDPKKVKKVSKT